MLRKYCVLVPIVAFCLLFMSCYFDNGHKEVSYGNVHFVNAGATMTIDPCPPPDNVDFVLPDERRIHLASVNKKQAIELFGEPFLVGKINQGATSYEEYGVKHVCTFVFENGQLTTVYATGGVKVINVLNDKSLTLPAKEPDQVEVFGKPTAVNYRKSQQP